MSNDERPLGLIVLRDDDGEVVDSYMSDCTCKHDWQTHPDTGCLGIDSYGCECECPGYEPNPEFVCEDCGSWTGGDDCPCYLTPRPKGKP